MYRIAFRISARQSLAAMRASSSSVDLSHTKWDIKVLYDGDCPLCMQEIDFLRKRDKQQKIGFVDIASTSYSPDENSCISFEQAMRKIHGITSDGRVIEGVEVFRRLYEAVGLGWVYSLVRIKPIGDLAEAVYGVWAKYRMEITGREALDIILAKRSAESSQMCTSSEKCDQEKV